MKKVLYCTDFSTSCAHVRDFIAAWIKDKPITLDIVHVFDARLVTLALPLDPLIP
ncbi:MAG: hypothetical protein KJP00_08095 [Bacteroidia bacterium]|nr:hypothetical protein [Bacteroidia bacterium]